MSHKLTDHAPLFASVQLCLGSFFFYFPEISWVTLELLPSDIGLFLLFNLNEARAKETIAAYLKGLREGTPEEQADGEFVSR